MKTPRRLQNTLVIVAIAFTCGIICSLAGCGGTSPLDLPVCQSDVPGATLDTETCVGDQATAICRWNPPGPDTKFFGCITGTVSASGDKAGIECVENCPPNQYDSTPSSNH